MHNSVKRFPGHSRVGRYFCVEYLDDNLFIMAATARLIYCCKPVHFPRESHKPFPRPPALSQRSNRSSITCNQSEYFAVAARSPKKAIINQNKLEIYCYSQQIRETAAVVTLPRVRKSRTRMARIATAIDSDDREDSKAHK